MKRVCGEDGDCFKDWVIFPAVQIEHKGISTIASLIDEMMRVIIPGIENPVVKCEVVKIIEVEYGSSIIDTHFVSCVIQE